MENQDIDPDQQVICKKNKKLLDKGDMVWYYSQARLRETAGRGEANLENDTEKKRANIKERLAKIPKSETSKDVNRIKRKSLILAQDERWRRA